MRELDIDMKNTVSIGDGENDIGLFLESGHSIAFNPINERVASSGEAVIDVITSYSIHYTKLYDLPGQGREGCPVP